MTGKNNSYICINYFIERRNFNMKESSIQKAGVGEKIQYLVHEQNDNTVRLEVNYPANLSAGIMEQAVLSVVKKIDVLHSTFFVKNGKAYWRENKDVIGADCFSAIETEDNPEKFADYAMLSQASPDKKTQLFCTLINGMNKASLTLIISHLCVDGSDAKYLLEKIVEAYNLILLENSTDKLELKTGSRSSFQIYKNLKKKDILSAFKPVAAKGKSPFPFADEDAGCKRIVKYTLNNRLVEQMKKFGKANNVTLNDLLLTSFYRAYINMPESVIDGPIAISSMMDLRRHKKNGESDGLANMSGAMPTVLENSIHGSFKETLKEISAQTKKSKEDPIAGLYGMPMIHLMGKLFSLDFLMEKISSAYKNSNSIGMTNLGNLSREKLAINGICPETATCGGPLKKKPGMQISVIGISGTITLSCIGEYSENDEKLIRSLIENIIHELETLVINENI